MWRHWKTGRFSFFFFFLVLRCTPNSKAHTNLFLRTRVIFRTKQDIYISVHTHILFFIECDTRYPYSPFSVVPMLACREYRHPSILPLYECPYARLYPRRKIEKACSSLRKNKFRLESVEKIIYIPFFSFFLPFFLKSSHKKYRDRFILLRIPSR